MGAVHGVGSAPSLLETNAPNPSVRHASGMTMTLATMSNLAVGLLFLACSCSGTRSFPRASKRAPGAFGRKQGAAIALADKAQVPGRLPANWGRKACSSVCPPGPCRYRILQECCSLYLGSPTAEFGRTYGTMPAAERQSWRNLRCGQWRHQIATIRRNTKRPVVLGRVKKYQNADVGTYMRAVVAEGAKVGDSGYGPLIVNLGQGTTATHAAWAATASMGIRSLHWGDIWEAGRHIANLNDNVSVDHWNFVMAYSKLCDCINKNQNCVPPTVILHLLKTRADAILGARGAALSLGDVPYASAASYVISASLRLRGRMPMLFMTMRSPKTWAAMRARNHGGDPICMDHGADTGDAFDVIACLERGIKRGHVVRDMFKAQSQIAPKILERLIGDFQAKWSRSPHVFYATDLFARKERVLCTELALELQIACAANRSRCIGSSRTLDFLRTPKHEARLPSGGTSARRSSVTQFTPQQVATWLKNTIAVTQDVQNTVVKEEVDGAVMQLVVSEGDRSTLAELGITVRAQQTKIFARWKASHGQVPQKFT